MVQYLNIEVKAGDEPRPPMARAEAALRDAAASAVRIADLARAAGVSPRTVFRAAARHLGGPPMTQIRRSRLRQVRCRLLAAAPGETVTSAAMDGGFFHLGRFSTFYRRHFGESPSETLRRARAAGSRGSDIAGPVRRARSSDLPRALPA
jgi:transcriptional regulator GlxA family with amidase domain